LCAFAGALVHGSRSRRLRHPVLMQQAMQWVLDYALRKVTPLLPGYMRCSIHRRACRRSKAQVLIIVGAQDLATRRRCVRIGSCATAGFQAVGAGPCAHIASVEQAAKFTDAVQEFLIAVERLQ